MKKVLISILCIILLVNLPLVSATFENFDANTNPSPPQNLPHYSNTEQSVLAGYTPGEVGFFSQPSSPLSRLSAAFSTTFGNPQDVGEALILYAGTPSPPFVRSSLLEQQDTPVFIPLKATDFGSLLSPVSDDPSERDPLSGLTSLPSIKNVVIHLNKTNTFVRSVRYIPPRSGFTKDNFGYLVIILNKLRNETSLPTASAPQTSVFNNSLPKDIISESLSETPVINLDLTAEIYFDLNANNLLNLGGTKDLTLKPETEPEFLQKVVKEENSFANGKAFVRAATVTDDRVTLIVYNKELLPLSLFSPANAPAGRQVQILQLSRSTPLSRPFRLGLSGNPFEDTVFFKLNEILSPGKRALFDLSTDGKTFSRKANEGGQIYSGSNWKISSINHEKENLDRNQKLERALTFNLDKITMDRVQADIENVDFFTDTIILKNIATGASKKVVRQNLGGKTLSFDLAPLDDASVKYLEEKYCPQNSPQYGCESLNRFKKILISYPGLREEKDAYLEIFDIYKKNLIPLKECALVNGAVPRDHEEECKNAQIDMTSLAYSYADKVQSTQPELLEKWREGFGGKGGSVFLEDENVRFELKRVELPSALQMGKADLTVNDGQMHTLTVGDTIPDIPQGQLLNRKKVNLIEIKQIKQNAIVVEKRDAKVDYTQTFPPPLQTITLGTGHNEFVYDETKDSDGKIERKTVSIDLKHLETNTEASITITPGTGQGLSRSSFQVHIPIEPRPFKFTPEQLRDQINATRALIVKLDSVINKLDAVVRTWKKICLVTFAFITLKSSFLGGTARSLARTTVSKMYQKKCTNEVNTGTTFKTIDECLSSYSKEITNDVDANQKAIESVNQQLKGQTPGNLEQCGDVKFQEVKTLGATIEQCREYLRLKALDGKGSETLKSTVQNDLSSLKFLEKKHEYEQAKTLFENNKKDLLPTKTFGADEKEAEKRAIQFYAEQATELKQTVVGRTDIVPLRTLVVNSEKPSEATAIILKANSDGSVDDSSSAPQDLVKLSELQVRVYEEGVDSVMTRVNNECKNQANNCVTTKLQTLNNTPDPSNIFITKNTPFLQDAQTSTDLQPPTKTSLSGLKLLMNNNILITKTSQHPTNFKLYASQITDIAGGLRSTDYAYVQNAGELTAEYDANSGLAYCYPTGMNGEYIKVLERYQGNSDIKIFRAMNVGQNGIMECDGGGDDVLAEKGDESALALPENAKLRNYYLSIIQNAKHCKNDGDPVGEVTKKSGGKVKIKCSMKQSKINLNLNAPKCIDVMDAQDCTILFNACDPVMCPASRCNLGGRYNVPDVIQSGLVGSAILCAPNIKQGVLVPVCLTGILAGLKNIRTLLQSYSDCLEVNLKDGKNVGLCDYIRSVGICELAWREMINLFKIKGAVVDYLSEKAFGEPEGGAEYLTFQSSLQNVGQSFNYFTTEYSNTYVAALKGSSTEEIGSQVCRLGVYGRLPTVGEVLDKLSEPEDPPQFFAFFDDAPYVQNIGESPSVSNVAGNVKELSNYKIFYHIYAGTGFAQQQAVFAEPLNPATGQPNKAVTYSVYLVNRQLGLPPLYVTLPGDTLQQSANIARGQYAQNTVQKVATSGYNEICIMLNGKESCGFGKVTSAFSLNYLSDKLAEAETGKKIESPEDCVPSVPTTSASLGSITTPEKYGVLTTGIVRVCNPTLPTADPPRWASVGSCGKDSSGVDRGTCWLDKKSIKIQDVKAKQELLLGLKKDVPPEKLLSQDQSIAKLFELNKARDAILDRLKNLVAAAPEQKEEEPVVEINGAGGVLA